MTDKRINTRNKILECARKVFMNKGLYETSMSDIATEVGVARRTLYRHFETKESIAYEVMLSTMEVWNTYQLDIYAKLQGTGLEKLESFLLELLEYMDKNTHIMKFMSDFDYYFKDTLQYELGKEVQARTENIIHVSDQLISNLIEIGIKDDSIELQDRLRLIVATISNVLWVFGQRIAIRGKRIQKESGIASVELIKCQIRMYVEVLRKY